MGVKFDEEFLDAASRSSVTFGFAVPAAGFGVADELFLGAQPGLEAGTGISWNDLPQELGCGSGVTCWRLLRQWQDAGVWPRLHRVVLDRLAQQGLLDWSRAAVDSVSVRAKRRGELTGPSPTDRGKAGSKYHVVAAGRGAMRLRSTLL